MNLKVNLLVLLFILSGCAGSPMQTSFMSRNELVSVDNDTLCKAATPFELYSPSDNVIMEVRRRSLDCRLMDKYTPKPIIVAPQPQQAKKTYAPSQKRKSDEPIMMMINGKPVLCLQIGVILDCN